LLEGVDVVEAVFVGYEFEEVEDGVVVVWVWEDDLVVPFWAEKIEVVLGQRGRIRCFGIVHLCSEGN
jgi:hypothetical protein